MFQLLLVNAFQHMMGTKITVVEMYRNTQDLCSVNFFCLEHVYPQRCVKTDYVCRVCTRGMFTLRGVLRQTVCVQGVYSGHVYPQRCVKTDNMCAGCVLPPAWGMFTLRGVLRQTVCVQGVSLVQPAHNLLSMKFILV
jgi:hypothetical protein